MALIEQKNKFDVKNPHMSSKIVEDQFFRWTSGNFYRTSYNDMGSKGSVERKNCAIPGYKGYVPGIKNAQVFGKRFTEQTRDVFVKEKLDDKQHLFASTGFNAAKMQRHDDTLHASSNRYGKSTMMSHSPNWRAENQFRSTMQASYDSPQKLHRVNWRTRENSIEFDNTSTKFNQIKKADAYHRSGFTANSTLFDGNGWQTEKNMHSDQVRTIYRNLYNTDKPFHKVNVKINDGLLKKKEQVYDKE